MTSLDVRWDGLVGHEIIHNEKVRQELWKHLNHTMVYGTASVYLLPVEVWVIPAMSESSFTHGRDKSIYQFGAHGK